MVGSSPSTEVNGRRSHANQPPRVLFGSNLLGLLRFNPRSSHRVRLQDRRYGLRPLARRPAARLGRDNVTDQRAPTEYDQLVRDLVVERLCSNPQWQAGYNTGLGVDAREHAERKHRAQSAAQVHVGRSCQ
jgi:hypothetical protein